MEIHAQYGQSLRQVKAAVEVAGCFGIDYRLPAHPILATMQFPTVGFTMFFLAFLAIWWCLPSRAPRARACTILVGSLIFYAVSDWRFVGVLLGVGVLAYLGSRWLQPAEGSSRRTRGWLLVTALIVHLAGWKYAQFATLARNDLAQSWGWEAWSLPEWAYPVGLSFFTFHALALIISVWHRRSAPQSLLSTLAHVAFFPSLLAGPVLRADAVAPRLSEDFQPSATPWLEGIFRIALGMGFKWVLAAKVAEWADPVFQGMSTSAGEVWWGVHAYALQIFFDFAGYSYMAIGLALLLGFRLPENFTEPYLASSVQDFWRRWHRSLSFFFRDHLYIDALGGNRNGLARGLMAAAFTMVVSGLWHGASLLFVIWGAWHAAALLLERFLPARKYWPSWLGWLVTVQIVVWGWVWFRAPDMTVAKELFTLAWSGPWEPLALSAGQWAWAGLCLAVVGLERALRTGLLTLANRIDRPQAPAWSSLVTAVGLSVFAYGVIMAGPEGVPNFIYNAF